MIQKPGYLTTEFWLVMVAALLSVAVAGGYLAPEQSSQIGDAVAQAINAISNLVSVLTPLISIVVYVWSRTKIKLNSR